jgi:hypothetical protein
MHSEGIKAVITKAITDEKYRKHLLEKPDEAIKGYELSEAEKKMLRNLKSEAFEELDMDVEERQSKSGLLMGLGSLMTGRDAASGDVSTLINILMNKYG